MQPPHEKRFTLLHANDCAGNVCGHVLNTCTDRFRNHTCHCALGFQLQLNPETDKEICVDVDDCADNPCGSVERHGMRSPEQHVCVDLIDDYQCFCASGYRNDTPKCSEFGEKFLAGRGGLNGTNGTNGSNASAGAIVARVLQAVCAGAGVGLSGRIGQSVSSHSMSDQCPCPISKESCRKICGVSQSALLQ